MMLSCKVRLRLTASIRNITQVTKLVTSQAPASWVLSRPCSSLSPAVEPREVDLDPVLHPHPPRIVTSPIPDIDIPERHFSNSVWENVFESPMTPFRTALINGDNGRSYSYKESHTITR